MTSFPPGVQPGQPVEFLKPESSTCRCLDERRCCGRVLKVCGNNHLVVDTGHAWGLAQIVPPERVLRIG